MAKTKELPPENPAPANPFVEDGAPTIDKPWSGAPIEEAAHMVPELSAAQIAEMAELGAIVRADDAPIHLGAESNAEPMHPAEHWHAELETKDWELAAARQHAQWPVGREMTRAQFEEAVRAASGLVSR